MGSMVSVMPGPSPGTRPEPQNQLHPSPDRPDIGAPINEIGSYSGTVPLQGPALVEVQSSGSWTITPQ